jgi:hypothetical protein
MDKQFVHINLLLDKEDRFLGFQQEAFRSADRAEVEGKKTLEDLAPVIRERLGAKLRAIKVELKDE